MIGQIQAYLGASETAPLQQKRRINRACCEDNIIKLQPSNPLASTCRERQIMNDVCGDDQDRAWHADPWANEQQYCGEGVEDRQA